MRKYATAEKYHISRGVSDHHGNSGMYDVCFGGMGCESVNRCSHVCVCVSGVDAFLLYVCKHVDMKALSLE